MEDEERIRRPPRLSRPTSWSSRRRSIWSPFKSGRAQRCARRVECCAAADRAKHSVAHSGRMARKNEILGGFQVVSAGTECELYSPLMTRRHLGLLVALAWP